MKLIKLAMLAFLMVAVAACTGRRTDTNGGGDGNSTEGTGGYETDVGVGTGNNSGIDGDTINGLSAAEMAELRRMTTFYFQYDSADLLPESMRALDVHAYDLMKSSQRVVLDGHTDERGTREYNMALGERRGNSVRNYLTMQGVPSSQIEVVSYGKERPIAKGHDDAAWSQNRRVELRVQ